MDNGTLTDAQKLEALIKRAIESGWEKDYWQSWLSHGKLHKSLNISNIVRGMFEGEGRSERDILFNHDFARALFGTDEISDSITLSDGSPYISPPKWAYRLQMAVVSDNPIDYMYQAVFSNICECGHEQSDHQVDGPETYCANKNCDCDMYKAVSGEN